MEGENLIEPLGIHSGDLQIANAPLPPPPKKKKQKKQKEIRVIYYWALFNDAITFFFLMYSLQPRESEIAVNEENCNQKIAIIKRLIQIDKIDQRLHT